MTFDGFVMREKHTLYAPGTPDECRKLIDVGTSEDANGRLNVNAFRVEWASDDRATIRTAKGLPRCSTRVRLSRHEWGSTAEAATQLDAFQVAVAWLFFLGCVGITIGMASRHSEGQSLTNAIIPFGLLALAGLIALVWSYASFGKRDAVMVNDLALAIGANSVDGVLSPQYALRPNWPPPSDASVRSGTAPATSQSAATRS